MAAKKFSLTGVVLSVICVVLTIEAAAPAAAMGNVQFFWWGLLIITFLIPYGLVVAELGTTYDSEGGLYDWVRTALGDTWAARCAWCYWVNFPLWMASLACIFPGIIGRIVGMPVPLPLALAIELAFVWIVTLLSCSPLSEAEWILNGGAIVKVAISLVVGGLGIWFVWTHGFANDMAPVTFLPDLTDRMSLTRLSVILFNFMGFEVVATFAGSMKRPARDIPRAIVAGGLAVAAIYLLCGVGIGAAVPRHRLSMDSGIMDAVGAILGPGHPVAVAVGAAFLLTLFANMAGWSFGVNSVACRAAGHGNMPRAFAVRSRRTGMPNGSALLNGSVASAVLLLQIPLGPGSRAFWALFSANIVFLLLSYIPMFPAFWRLRRHDARLRVFRVPGGDRLLMAILAVPAAEIVLSVIATTVPLGSAPGELAKVPVLVGVAALLVIGEAVRIASKHGRSVDHPGIARRPRAEG